MTTTSLRTDPILVDGTAASWREVDGEVVVLSLATSAYLNLNASGSLLWPLLVRGTTVTEMADALVEAYDLAPADAAGDVEDFVAAVGEHQLLRPRDAAR